MDHPDNAEAARPPAELLDELRLRLLRLDQNHPSRPQQPAQAVPAVSEGESGAPDQAEDLPTEPTEDPPDGPEQLTSSASGPTADSPGADWTNLPGLRGSTEPYRPWFMGSDTGVPWFTDG